MTKVQWYALAVASWLGALCCGIAYAGLSDDGKNPTPLLIAGGVLLVGVGVVMWRRPKQIEARRAARAHPMDAVVDAIRTTRDGMYVLAGFMGFGALAFGGLLLLDSRGKAQDLGAAIGVAVLCAAIAVLGLVRARRFADPRNNDLIDAILHRPRDVAWIYMQTMQFRGQTFHHLHVWTAARKHYVLRLEEQDIDVVMRELAARAPHAMRPHSSEARRAFKRASAGFEAAAGAQR